MKIFIFLSLTLSSFACAPNNTPTAKISLVFDDGFASALNLAAPILQKYGLKGTGYIITSCIGMSTFPNTCKASNNRAYMTWEEVNRLKNVYNWEIGSHTHTHPLLASVSPDFQPEKLTISQVIEELQASIDQLKMQGIFAENLAPPFGDYDMDVLGEAAKLYRTNRGFHDTGYNDYPYNEYLLRVQKVQGNVSVATVKSYIDSAIANKQWLILVFHEIKTTASVNESDYEYSSKNLESIASYIKQKKLANVKVSDAIVRSDVNLLPNSTFNDGMSGGWRTNNPEAVFIDMDNNGSFPDSKNSVKFITNSNPSHLFSPLIGVNFNTTYLIKSFLNVKEISGGEVFFYIDEYDGLGNWISGQYKMAEKDRFLENINFTYNPSSQQVTFASLQIGATENAAITAVVDNIEFIPLNLSDSSKPVTTGNVMPNFNFNSGLSSGWSADSALIVKDSTGKGSPANATYSIKAVASASDSHLFSPKIAVDSLNSYSITSFIRLSTCSLGGVSIHVDEYDASGNVVAEQFILENSTLGFGNFSFNYKPSSSSVQQASLRYIFKANSGVTAYIDNVIWIKK